MKKTLIKSFLIVGCIFLSTCFFYYSAFSHSNGYKTDSGKVKGPWKVWSSWYFPYHDDYNPNLYDDGEAMARYDSYIYNRFGVNNYAQWWESYYHGMPQNPDPWWGHCHAWAGAAVWEPQPKKERKVEDVPFRIRDRKGLLIESYFKCADGTSYELAEFQPSPGLFWRYLRDEIKGLNPMHGHSMGFVGELYYGDEVWNYPIYAYKVKYSKNDFDILDGTMTIYVATDGDPYYADSGRLYTKIFTYVFWGVELYSGQPIDSGYWIGDENDPYSRPDAIWRPYYAPTWMYYMENEYLEEDPLSYILNP